MHIWYVAPESQTRSMESQSKCVFKERTRLYTSLCLIKLSFAMQEEYKDEKGSVVGSDFYGATELLGLSDAQIVDKVVRNITRCEPSLKGAKV